MELVGFGFGMVGTAEVDDESKFVFGRVGDGGVKLGEAEAAMTLAM